MAKYAIENGVQNTARKVTTDLGSPVNESTIRSIKTGINLLPVGDWTMEAKDSKQVNIVGINDKRQITALLIISKSGVLLPPQIIYAGTTEQCHQKYGFPNSWNIYHSENHWSNTDTMLHYIEHLLVSEILSNDMQMKSLLERLKQEENRHQETKKSIISERKELWMKLEAAVQIEHLAMEASNNTKDIITHETQKTSLGERKDLAIKLDAEIQSKDNLIKRLRECEIDQKKMKDLIIAERLKMGAKLTLYLCGLTWSGEGTSVYRYKGLRCTYKPDYTEMYEGVKISIMLCGSHLYKRFQDKKFRQSQKKNLAFVYNFNASGKCTPELIRQFESFIKSCESINGNIVTVFTRQTEIKMFDKLKDNTEDSKCHMDQWLDAFSETISSMVRNNAIKCMLIEHSDNIEFPGKYKQELFSLCGLNIF
ncbi:Hypothetical predicted protein [Mytilus galloprovincialis]|uniref:DDE-1 domain-containing protein n=1 Tax=Mytilus galloprovincialis TaxID=29158 RepID=A0A8B6EM43_MYTGA|nr:Hypothetical predicted protein [Mytilus galloprovincialis]